jgi:hypothetical protein
MKVALCSLAVIASTGFFAACKRDTSAPWTVPSGDDGGALGTNPSLTDFCNALAPWLFRDCSCSQPDDRGSQFVAAYYCDALSREVAQGNIAYDASQAGACVAAARTASCAPSGSADWSTCHATLSGKVAAGQACLAASPLLTPATPLVSPCAAGLFCMPSSKTDACSGVCIALPKTGASCRNPVVCVSRSCTIPCAPGAVCNAQTGMCEAPASTGQPCGGTSGSICADGLYCQPTDGGTSGACQPKAASGPCTQQDQCASPNICSMTADGSAAGQCVAAQYAQAGDPCSPFGNPVCGCSTACGADGTCAALPDPGSPCDFTNQIYGDCHGGFCDTSDAGAGLCRPIFSASHPCTTDAQCGAYGHCATQQCIAACY